MVRNLCLVQSRSRRRLVTLVQTAVMAPTYKLTYFPIKKLAEPIRYILSYGGQDFEDNRLDPKQWPEIKKTMPFGKVPVLEMGEKTVTQSLAICRYLAKQYKLVGSSDWDALNIDIAVDTLCDFRSICADFFATKFNGGDQDFLDKKEAEMKKDTLPYYLPKFEDMVKNNGGYFVNNQLTWADLYFTAMTDSMMGLIGDNILDNYPHLKGIREKVLALPNIKKWIEKRPKTNY